MATALELHADNIRALVAAEIEEASTPPDDRHRAWEEAVASKFADLSANSHRAYRRDLDRWTDFLATVGLHPVDATVAHARVFGRWLKEYSRLAPATIARTLGSLSGIYRDVLAHSYGIVAANPFEHVRRPKLTRGSTTPTLTLAEARVFLAAADEVSPRAAALARLLLMTGVRISEALGADLGDLSLRRDRGFSLKVVRKGGAWAQVAIPRPVWKALVRYHRDRSPGGTALVHAISSRDHAALPLFAGRNGRMTASEARREFERICRQAGWEANRVTPHGARHSFATIALESCAQPIRHVQQALGHSTITTTETYLHDQDAGHEVVRAVSDVLA